MANRRRMIPWETLDRARTPDGEHLELRRRGQEYLILVEGQELMSNRLYGSEKRLAELACEGLGPAPQVLIGGLGMGYTLRAALDVLGPDAQVTVAELIPEVVEWNRGPLASLAGSPLEDPRVEVQLGDVARLMRGLDRWDAIMLDVDNGPEAFTCRANGGLYTEAGLTRIYRALRGGGVLGVWSCTDDCGFEKLLAEVGFDSQALRVRARQGKRRRGGHHYVFLGVKPTPARALAV